ncbi:MAG: Na+/H+ antiporter NhaC family protein [Cyanobacteria bacterium]|nr:Na+/H+ antiporter NhaC family protein [Cyanobacteriota bacterium]MDA0865344.1 Na+/H+ antiporter NhaC family protein [Cyanobacteriota bacterium]
MDSAIALALSFIVLLVSVQKGIPTFYPLLGVLALMTGIYRRRGVPLQQLWMLMQQGVRQSAGVISILLLIGLVVASWLIAGTVPALVYYGLQLIHPRWFLVSAFLLTGLVSVLLGTSFGSAGTIGLALMIMARGAGVDEHWAAGAIISGAYIGDRCSPMSSSAHLVATLTGTDIYPNLRQMLATGWGALLLSMGIYTLASLRYALSIVDNPLIAQIPPHFSVHPVTLLPAGLLVVLTLWRVPVQRTLGMSLGSAIALAFVIQAQSGLAVLQTLLMGLQLPSDNPLREIFQGGGLLAMGRVCAIVAVSTALAGLLSGMGTLNPLSQWLSRWPGKRGLFGSIVVTGALTSAFGCTQTIAILLTQQIARPLYCHAHPEQLAVDIENSAVVLAPLVPWNIAGLVPVTVLLTDAGFIPYGVYLYLLPLLNWLFRKPLRKRPAAESANVGTTQVLGDPA